MTAVLVAANQYYAYWITCNSLSLKIIPEPDTMIFNLMFYNYTVFFGYFLRVPKVSYVKRISFRGGSSYWIRDCLKRGSR